MNNSQHALNAFSINSSRDLLHAYPNYRRHTWNNAERHYFTIDKVTRCPIVIYMLLFRQRQQKDQNITKLAPKIFKPAEVMSDLSEY